MGIVTGRGPRMPAEWEPHEATWIAWPHEESDWPGKFEPVQWVYAEFARYVTRGEILRVLVADAVERSRAREVFRKSGVDMARVEFLICPTDRSWTRDYCPLFVHGADGQVMATDWEFNGWAKYGNWKRDNAVPGRIARKYKMPALKPGLVLEGGAIDVNGAGALLATEECLLSDVQERNPGAGRQEMEDAFRKYLGVTTVLWLRRGIAGDDTHGHVDDIARFVDPRTVVAADEEDPADSNYEPLRENLDRLRTMKDQDRRRLKVVKLPMPRRVDFDGQRLPASYLNFYIANAAVLVPVFNDPADRVALQILAKLFPDRTVTGIYCRDLVLGLGTLHCMTQQQPRSERE